MFLIIIKGTTVGNVFSLNKVGSIVIGRGKECDVQILDLTISRKHCQIEERNSDFYIKDLKSKNKTIINKRIVEDEEKLNIGDIIEIGNTTLLFTSQKEIPIESVADYDNLRMSHTRSMENESTLY